MILPVNGGLAFNTFYPAVIAAAMLLGVGPGLLASGLSAVCAVYFFLTPLESIGHTGGYLASLGFFLMTCALTCFLAFRMQRSASALRASEHKLRSLFEASSVGIVLTDMASRFVDFNEAYRGFTGYAADELRTLTDWALTDKNESTGTDDLVAMAKRTGHFGPLEKDYVRKNHSRIPLRFNGALFTGDDGQQYLWSIVEDISDQRSLQRAVLESTSAEQQKLGHDLHDGLSQELTGISMLAADIAVRLKRDGRPEAANLETLAAVAKQAVANCRAIAHGLSPVTFADGGLIEALNEMVALNRDSFGIAARCEVTGGAPIRLDPDVLDNLYRVSQEAVTNARRHGGAKTITVRLDVQPTKVRLDILDDGAGISQPNTEPTGMGLKIMKFRVANMGARLWIGPAAQGGTLVSVDCPQPPERHGDPPARRSRNYG